MLTSRYRKDGEGSGVRSYWAPSASADTWAKEGAKVGVNEMLEYIDQAVTAAAGQVIRALDHIAGMAKQLVGSGGSWGDAVAPPKREPRERPPPPATPAGQAHAVVATGHGFASMQASA